MRTIMSKYKTIEEFVEEVEKATGHKVDKSGRKNEKDFMLVSLIDVSINVLYQKKDIPCSFEQRYYVYYSGDDDEGNVGSINCEPVKFSPSGKANDLQKAWQLCLSRIVDHLIQIDQYKDRIIELKNNCMKGGTQNT
jgi:hypothetical protein